MPSPLPTSIPMDARAASPMRCSFVVIWYGFSFVPSPVLPLKKLISPTSAPQISSSAASTAIFSTASDAVAVLSAAVSTLLKTAIPLTGVPSAMQSPNPANIIWLFLLLFFLLFFISFLPSMPAADRMPGRSRSQHLTHPPV